MSLLLSITGNVTGGEAGTPTVRPTITEVSAIPSEIVVQLSDYGGGDTVFFIDDDPAFLSPTSVAGVNGVGTFLNQGSGLWFVRGKKDSATALFSNSITVEVTATQLRSLTISANAGDGSVTVNHDCSASEPNTDYVSVKRRQLPDGLLAEIGTFSPTTSPYVDNTVTNGLTYEYRLDLIPDSVDYSLSTSNLTQATPTASTPTLGAPNTLAVAWDEVTGGSGTFTFVDGSGGNADNYEVNIKVTSTGISAASTTLTAPTASYAFSGLTVGVGYTFEVYATAAGFNNSSTSSITRTAIDPNATVILPEDQGIEGFYIPLDGSYTRGAQQPLIRFTPLTESTFNALSTGLTFADYPNGATLIIPTDNANTPITGLFAGKSLVDKSFCGIRARLNPVAPNASPWPNGDVSSRYSTVIWKDDDKFIVDLNYNGGNIDSPQETTNGQGYVFSDESANMDSLSSVIEDLSTSNIVDFSAFDYATTGKTIVCPTWRGVDMPAGKAMKIYTNDANIEVRIKVGYEDYYHIFWGNNNLIDGDVLGLRKPIFDFDNYTEEFVTHNIVFVPQHTQYLTANGGGDMKILCAGTQKGGSMVAFINSQSWKVKEELEAGYGLGSANYFIMRSGQLVCANDASSLTGSGATQDVANFGFTFHKNGQFEGQFCLASNTSGSIAGATYSVVDDFDAKFEPQSNYAIASNEFLIKFKTDKTWIDAAGDKDYLPSHSIEITTPEASWFNALAMGGANRLMLIHVDRFIFLGNYVRYNQINGNYNRYYKGTSTPITTNNEGSGTRTAKNTLVDWEIVTEKESNGIDAKVICVSREYLLREKLDDLTAVGSGSLNVGLPIVNAIRSHINWPIMLGDYGININADSNALTYISEFDRKPKMWQNDDKFKVCAWVDVDSTTGLSVGDTITGNVSGNTASIAYIDNYRYTRRLILRGATGSFHTDTTITNGTVSPSVDDASTFNPTTVYTVSRMQRGQYPSNTQNNIFEVDSAAGLVTGQTLTGATTGASGTINAISGTQITVRSTNNILYQAGETFTTSAAIIQNTQPYIDENGKVYKYTGGEYLNGAKWINGSDFATSYAYVYYILDQDIDRFAYGSEYDPMLYVEVVTSNAEVLLDGTPRLARHTYKEGNGTLGNNTQNTTFSTKRRGGTNGHSLSDLPSYMFVSWPGVGSISGHTFYTPAEITRFWRNGNVYFGVMRLNASSVTKTALYGLSKGYTIANVAGILAGENGEWDSPQANSSARQFETARQFSIAYPSHDPAYATNEGMTYPAKYILAGTNKNDDIGTWDDANSNPTGENVIRQDEIPNLPTTCQNLLDSLPQ